jgi:CP family cyanate transporter-like MFS transporter
MGVVSTIQRRSGEAVAGRHRLLVVALVLTGLSMRTAVTSIGAVLVDLEHGVHASSGAAGVITTLPVICFAALGGLTPRLSARLGAHRLLVLSLVAMAVGLALRAMMTALWPFLLLSVLALSGGAVANVVLPVIVKRDFPDRIGRMTALYTTALAIGATAGAGLTVPIGSLGDGWRLGLGSWALFAAVAVLPWLTTLSGDHGEVTTKRAVRAGTLLRSRTAWALTIFFAFQSFQAYVTFGWYAIFLHDHGLSKASAGWLVALLSALSIPVSMIAPTIAPRHHRAVIVGMGVCYGLAYLGFGLAPNGGAVAWMVLAGIGSGMFPMALTMIGLRARTPDTTNVLSAFVQSIGYVVAGTGPLLFGVLHGASGGWTLPLATVWVALALAVVSGWVACAPRYVDDEIASVAGAVAPR